MQAGVVQPVVFLSHGGGPLPLLNDPGHAELLAAFERIRERLQALPRSPSALLFVSAHWEADEPVITSAAAPSLFFDYHGFPPETYQLRYPVSGAPALAEHLAAVLNQVGFKPRLDLQRGLDHGVFVPAMLLFPEADVPCLQVSLLSTLDPARHIELGKALSVLREQNVLILGSGFSFHNMRAFFAAPSEHEAVLNHGFEAWLEQTLREVDQAERESRLRQWREAPGADFCHPREEHLLPIHVCAGAARTPVTAQWHFTALGRQGSCYWWD